MDNTSSLLQQILASASQGQGQQSSGQTTQSQSSQTGQSPAPNSLQQNIQAQKTGQPPVISNPQGYAAQQAAIADPKMTTALSQAGGQLDGSCWDGLCEAYSEQMTYGKTGLFPSAVSAWQAYSNSGDAHPGLQGIQPGDILYYASDTSNGGFGHSGIYDGDGNFTSATYNGVQTNNLAKWSQMTGQQLLGYVTPQK